MDTRPMAWRIQQMQAKDKGLDSMSAEELHVLLKETKPSARNFWLDFPVGDWPGTAGTANIYRLSIQEDNENE